MGSKVVTADKNPNGPIGGSGKKERVLKDLTNSLELGSVNSKPTYTGPRFGVDNSKGKNVVVVGWAHEGGAHVKGPGIGDGVVGSRSRVGD